MARGETAAGDLVPAMLRKGERLADDQRGAMADNRAFIFGYELPFREVVDLTAYLRAGEAFGFAINLARQRRNSSGVGWLRLADDELGVCVGFRARSVCQKGTSSSRSLSKLG